MAATDAAAAARELDPTEPLVTGPGQPVGEPGGSAGASQHRRRQRAPRGVANERDGDPAGRRAGDRGTPDGLSEPDGGQAATAAVSSTEAFHPTPAQQAGGSAPPRDDRRRGDTRDDRRRGESAVERSLRALVSTRTTQLPFTVAMRAREVARPSAQDLADAERDLVIVRRHYVPPAPLVTKKSEAGGRAGSNRPDEAAGKSDGRRRRSGRG